MCNRPCRQAQKQKPGLRHGPWQALTLKPVWVPVIFLHDTGSRLTRILRLQKWNAALTALCPPFFPEFPLGRYGRKTKHKKGVIDNELK